MPKYFIQVFSEVDNHSITKISLQTFSFVILYSIQESKFYFFCKSCDYLSKTSNSSFWKNLTPDWRRGIELKDTSMSSLMRDVQPNEMKRIRKEDFRQLFFLLKNRQKLGIHKILLSLRKETIVLTLMNMNHVQILDFDFFYKKIINLAFGFYEKINKQIKKGDFTDKHLFILEKKKIVNKKLIPLYSMLYLLNKSEHIFIASDSFKLIIYFTKVFDIKYRALTLFQNESKYISYEIQNKKIKRVLILFNFFNNKSSNKYPIQEWQNKFPEIYFECISGSLSKERIKILLSIHGDFKNFDLVIYNGHSIIKNNKIQWLCTDGLFILEANSIHYYIHLSCMEFINKQDDIKNELPFREGLLPINLLPSQNFSKEITFFLDTLYTTKNFFQASVAFRENDLFSYWQI